MFEGECDLTYEEESQIEQPANIYSMIRTLEFIEWAFNLSHIDQATYIEQTNIILEQYKTTVDAYQDKFRGIDDFCAKYGLSDCRYAINRIKQGNYIAAKNTGPSLVSVVELNQRFNDVQNYFTMKVEGDPVMVADFSPLYTDFILSLTNCKNILNLDEDVYKKMFEWNSTIRGKKATDILESEDCAQLQLDLNTAYNFMTNTLNKK